jgi:hypothetical protein
VNHDLVRQVDDAGRGEAREHHTLHHPDERTLMTEVGRDGNDA